jgi:hypothetical protein
MAIATQQQQKQLILMHLLKMIQHTFSLDVDHTQTILWLVGQNNLVKL